MKDIPCICCGKALTNLDPSGNQPTGGTEFTTVGHYGSAVSDFMDGTGLAVNVCDTCLQDAGKKKRVLRMSPPKRQPRPRPEYHLWERTTLTAAYRSRR